MVRAAGRGRKPQWDMVTPRFLKHPPNIIFPRPLELVTRSEWSAAPRIELDTDIRLKLPIMHLRHTYTNTDECADREAGILFLQKLQRESQEKGFPDLMYNFLVGSDGLLYEGRGFDWKCTVFHDPWVNSKGESMNIAFIGRFPDVQAPSQFRATAKILTKWMLRMALLHEDYDMTPSICWPDDFNRPVNLKINRNKTNDYAPGSILDLEGGLNEDFERKYSTAQGEGSIDEGEDFIKNEDDLFTDTIPQDEGVDILVDDEFDANLVEE